MRTGAQWKDGLAKTRLPVQLLLFFRLSFLSQRFLIGSKSRRNFAFNFYFCSEKKTFLSRCRTWTSVSRLLHDNKGRKKLEQLVCSLGLYDKKQLYMRWSQFWHFRSNVPRYEVDLWCLGWFVQNMRTVLLPAPQFYTLVQFLFHRLNFVGFCTKFPLVAFLYKTFFLWAQNCPFLQVLRTKGSMLHTECVNKFEQKWKEHTLCTCEMC